MHDCVIREGALVENVVSDKDVVFGRQSQVAVSGENTPNEKYPAYLNTGISIFGKGAMVPDNMTIERNCMVYPRVTEEEYSTSVVKSGQVIGHEN